MDRIDLVRLFAALAEEDVAYVLVGGIALNLHGMVRATEDVDLFVRPDEDNVARLRRALASAYDDPDVNDIHAADLAGPYPLVRYVPREPGPAVDVLARVGDRFVYEDLEAEIFVLAGVPVKLATPATLMALKLATTRPVDLLDAERLRAAFGSDGTT